MFSRKNSSNSNAVSRATSLSDRGSIDVERPTQGLQAVHLSTSGRRTMSLEEDDDEDDYNPWDKLRATSGPMSAVSETGSGALGDAVDQPVDQPAEVNTLRISNLARGYTLADIYNAFSLTKADMRIEIQSPDSALVHFDDPSLAMKAYFSYLSSTNAIGTVSPHETNTAGEESVNASPAKHSMPVLRNRRSFQNANGTVLSALSSISAWRSSDKLSAMNNHNTNSHGEKESSRLGHKRSDSRGSINSKHVDRIPTNGSPNRTNTPASPNPNTLHVPHHSQNQPVTYSQGPDGRSLAPPKVNVENSRLAPTSASTVSGDRHASHHPSTQSKPSAARRIFSGSLSLKLPRRDKSEKEKDKKSTRD